MDEKTDKTKQLDKTHLVGQFYYTLARFQRKAAEYVAYGETEDDKLLRIQDLIAAVDKTGGEVMRGHWTMTGGILKEDCKLPDCYWNEELGMCMCMKEL